MGISICPEKGIWTLILFKKTYIFALKPLVMKALLHTALGLLIGISPMGLFLLSFWLKKIISPSFSGKIGEAYGRLVMTARTIMFRLSWFTFPINLVAFILNINNQYPLNFYKITFKKTKL